MGPWGTPPWSALVAVGFLFLFCCRPVVCRGAPQWPSPWTTARRLLRLPPADSVTQAAVARHPEFVVARRGGVEVARVPVLTQRVPRPRGHRQGADAAHGAGPGARALHARALSAHLRGAATGPGEQVSTGGSSGLLASDKEALVSTVRLSQGQGLGLGRRRLGDGCKKDSFTKVRVSLEEADNVPAPEGQLSSLYALAKWDDDVVTARGNGTHGQSVETASSPVFLSSSQYTVVWNSPWYTFDDPCGEDSLIFQIWEQDSAYRHRDDDSVDDAIRDDLVWEYRSTTEVSAYYEVQGSDDVCYQVSWESDNLVIDGVVLPKRVVRFVWCVDIVCSSGDTCFVFVSSWAWILIFGLFLFPTVLCVCCVMCMRGGGPRRPGAPRSYSSTALRRHRQSRRQSASLPVLAFGGLFIFAGPRRGRRVSGHQDDDDDDFSDDMDGAMSQGGVQVQEIQMVPAIHALRPRTLRSIKGQGEKLFEDEGCAVCLGELQDEDEVKKLPCGHVFHAQCIDSWGAQSSTCPLCKAQVDAKVAAL